MSATTPPAPHRLTARLRQYVRSSWRILVKEIAAFGVVGALAFVIDLGVFTWLQPHGALKAKAISTIVSTTFAYFGNRQWSFSHRARTSIARETSFFFGINFITLVIAEAMIALVVYAGDKDHDSLAVSITNIASVAVGTLFRFWAYKKFVFRHPDKVHAKNVDLEEELAE